VHDDLKCGPTDSKEAPNGWGRKDTNFFQDPARTLTRSNKSQKEKRKKGGRRGGSEGRK